MVVEAVGFDLLSSSLTSGLLAVAIFSVLGRVVVDLFDLAIKSSTNLALSVDEVAAFVVISSAGMAGTAASESSVVSDFVSAWATWTLKVVGVERIKPSEAVAPAVRASREKNCRYFKTSTVYPTMTLDTQSYCVV